MLGAELRANNLERKRVRKESKSFPFQLCPHFVHIDYHCRFSTTNMFNANTFK